MLALGRQFFGHFIEFIGGAKTMWRSFFMAIGIFCCILGAEFLMVDHVILRSVKKPQEKPGTVRQIGFTGQRNQVKQQKIYVPKDWMPWTLIGCGTVVLIYSFRPKN